MTADPRGVPTTCAPSSSATGAAHDADPLVEPRWPGVRVLAAVDDDGALIDEDGEPFDDGREIDLGTRAIAVTRSGAPSSRPT